MRRLRVALIAGGRSGEREVSLAGAREVEQALDPGRYEVRRYDPACDLARLAADASSLDVAFVLLHGPLGEDGAMQGFLDLLGIPYQGAGVLGSAVAMDKEVAKILYREAGLQTPRWRMVSDASPATVAALVESFGLPLVIKPKAQGSSLGMSIPTSESECRAGLEDALALDREVMVEQYVAGREITGGVLGNQEPVALPLVEIVPGEEFTFFDYTAKYTPGATREICPAPLDGAISRQAQDIALAAHRALRLRGYSRTDMIVAEDGKIYVLETNTIPGMTPTSLLPQAAAAAGLSFGALLERLIELALEER